MLAIVIPILCIGGIPYSLAIGIIGCVGYKELLELRKGKSNDYPNFMKLVGLILFLFLIYSNFEKYGLLFGLSYRILCTSILLLFGPIIFFKEKYTVEDAFSLFSKVLFLGIGFNLLISVYNYGVKYFVLLVLITTMTDTFALLGGTLIGKHSFTKISPNKTIEGCVVGSLLGTFISTMYYVNTINTSSSLVSIIFLILLLTIVGQIGDLFFSAIKRENKIKDFSNLIPGHGGVLDRLDSLLFVLFAFVALIVYF